MKTVRKLAEMDPDNDRETVMAWPRAFFKALAMPPWLVLPFGKKLELLAKHSPRPAIVSKATHFRFGGVRVFGQANSWFVRDWRNVDVYIVDPDSLDFIEPLMWGDLKASALDWATHGMERTLFHVHKSRRSNRHEETMTARTVAALYVAPRGVYFGIEGVDPWDEQRDARTFEGPGPVVAHPPCQRWGRYWSGGPMLARTAKAKTKGDDGGCFASAIAAVRKWGGVLEHPEASHAWAAFGLRAPPKEGGWVAAGDWAGFTCCVEQGHYGHRSRKATWLYVVGAKTLPSLKWGNSAKAHRLARLDDGFHSKEERRRAQKRGTLSRLSKYQRIATPPPISRSASVDRAHV